MDMLFRAVLGTKQRSGHGGSEPGSSAGILNSRAEAPAEASKVIKSGARQLRTLAKNLKATAALHAAARSVILFLPDYSTRLNACPCR